MGPLSVDLTSANVVKLELGMFCIETYLCFQSFLLKDLLYTSCQIELISFIYLLLILNISMTCY